MRDPTFRSGLARRYRPELGYGRGGATQEGDRGGMVDKRLTDGARSWLVFSDEQYKKAEAERGSADAPPLRCVPLRAETLTIGSARGVRALADRLAVQPHAVHTRRRVLGHSPRRPRPARLRRWRRATRMGRSLLDDDRRRARRAHRGRCRDPRREAARGAAPSDRDRAADARESWHREERRRRVNPMPREKVAPPNPPRFGGAEYLICLARGFTECRKI
jgi:hypothetical protein